MPSFPSWKILYWPIPSPLESISGGSSAKCFIIESYPFIILNWSSSNYEIVKGSGKVPASVVHQIHFYKPGNCANSRNFHKTSEITYQYITIFWFFALLCICEVPSTLNRQNQKRMERKLLVWSKSHWIENIRRNFCFLILSIRVNPNILQGTCLLDSGFRSTHWILFYYFLRQEFFNCIFLYELF